ncbi:MAG: DNA polymerase III subunit delta' [Candidatus Omnitrophica bacterium]|nr:DNA polymerase III subunit delta' [Candidatus Omnitrophota bacterium]MDD5351939.1 DNA polymerase III subunit delta' [Candidatus Omnitrophota bacterium]MDD5550765.1 DNA polymerase III subunit delta' [Candidatus Omnitrophota bacterium]
MSFKEIVNQDHIVNFLLSSYKADRISGAYLFLGSDGIGRTKMAKEFAKLINCKNAKGDCCDVCPSCKKIEEGNYVDIHWFKPINNAITISQVRELEKYVYLKPYESDKKVFIICDAQCLTEESSNALLKTLEEPTDDSVIILIANDISALLPTITSRCQKVIFNSIDEAGIEDILVHKHKVPLSHAHFISYLAEGSPGKALEFKDLREDLLQKRSHILNSVYFRKFSLFKMEEFSIKDNTQKRKSINLLLDILLSWFRDLLVVKTGVDTPLINLDKKEDLLKLNNQYSREELIKNISTICDTKFFINSNLNVKLTLSKMRSDLWK